MTRESEKAIVEASQIYPAFQQKPYLDGGIFGYNLAIDDAVGWLEKHLPQCIEIEENYVVVNYGLIADFEEAMKGE